MAKIKKPTGEIVEVEEGYELQEGEEFVVEETEPSEEEVKEELKTFIQTETINSLEKELDKISNQLINKFFNGVAEQRKKYLATGEKPKNLSDQEIVRKWFNALLEKDTHALKLIQKEYLNTTDNDLGGYLVPPQLVAEVNRFTEEYGFARRDMRYLPFSGAGNERKIPALDASVRVYWVGEGAAKTSTTPSFKLVTQTLKKLAAIVPITEELLQDSAIDIIRLLGELFGEAIAKEEDRVFFAGNTTNGDPFNGVLYADGVTKKAISGTSVSDLTVEELWDLILSTPRTIQQTGKFYLSSSVFRVIQTLKDGDGRYIVNQFAGATPTILGKPYEIVDVLPDSKVSGSEAPFLFFTDLSKTCVYGDKAGLAVKLLDQAIVKTAEESPSDLNLAVQDMVALRVVKRVGYVPVLPSGIAVMTLKRVQ